MIELCLIFAAWLSADLWWWRWAHRRAGALPNQRVWRTVLAGFMVAQVLYLVWYILYAVGLGVPDFWPRAWSTAAYLWHVLFLPFGCFLFVAPRLLRNRERHARENGPTRGKHDAGLTRRQLLGATLAAAPPVLTFAATGRASAQSGEFRVRKVDLPVPRLPADLDGLRVTHVTDLHLGRFMSEYSAHRIADAVNALPCDLVVFTGDVLDASAKVVSPAIDFVRRLDPRHGLVMIEGNHDVMQGADRFESEVRDAGLPLLLDESQTVRVPGRATPIQFLGITWGRLVYGREVHRYGKEAGMRFRKWSAEAASDSVTRVAAMRDPSAFPILLSHHPHGFDPAAATAIPLVLSGHTHGGQLMLTRNIGVGPLRFKYWSGLYRKPHTHLFISNGVGSWFPLRVNAPAEIVILSLRRVGQATTESAA